MVFDEIRSRDDDGVAETAVLSGILHFFRKYVAAVDYAGDVGHDDFSSGLSFANFVFAEVNMFDAFVGEGGGPVYAGLVVVVHGRGGIGVVHAQVGGTKTDVKKFFHTFAGGDNFRLARTEGSLFLPNGFPCDWASAAANDETTEGAELEKFNWGAVGDGVTELAAPACVAEGSEVVTL